MDSGILMIQDSILVCSPDPRIPHTATQAFTSGIIFQTQNFHTPYFSSGTSSFCYEMPDDIFPK
jgi:hypothetical protein